MKFIVSRTSLWDEKKKPCDEAKFEILTFIDERSVNDPQKISLKEVRDSWYTTPGFFNHRVEDGHIKRDFKKQTWTIEVNELEDLIGFAKKYGQIVIGPYIWNPELFEIEIYDDYRE